MKRMIRLAIWIIISLLAGLIGSYLFDIKFLLSFSIAGVALIINGLIAELEDSK